MKPGQRISTLVLIVIMVTISVVRLNRPQWDRNEILTWDVFGYYLYLPANFIYNDPKLENEQWVKDIMMKYPVSTAQHHVLKRLIEEYPDSPHLLDITKDVIRQYPVEPMFYQALQGPQGNRVILYTQGQAMLFAPFFFLAHATAEAGGWPADGFSWPYQFAIAMGCLLYTFIGLLFAQKILVRLFNDKVAAIVLVLIALGTNYFHLTAMEGIMPHNNLFMVYAIIIWLTIRWHESFRLHHAFLLGIFMAIAIIARGSEIVCLIIPSLWGVKSLATLREKLLLLWNKKLHVLVLAAGMFIIAFPQLLYWKVAAGKWLYDSYGEAGFSFLSPYVLKVLISYKKGWLLYTPLMIFSIAGFVSLYKYRRDLFLPCLLFFLFNFYIVSSWNVWWYAASFGQRALMQSYAVMMIPLAALVFQILQVRAAKRSVVFSIMGVLVVFNLFQTWQFSKGIIDPERMTKEYYWRVFLATSASEEDKKYLEGQAPDIKSDEINDESKYNGRLLATFNFDPGSPGATAERLDTVGGSHSFRLDPSFTFSPGLDTPYGKITSKDHIAIRASARIYSKVPLTDNPSSLIVTVMNGDQTLKYKGADVENHRFPANKWNTIKTEFITPANITAESIVKVYVWHRGQQPVWVDDLVIEIFEPREAD